MPTTQSATEFSQWLKPLRKQSRLSQSDLSDLATIDQGLISKYETGQKVPSYPETVIRLVKAIAGELRLEVHQIAEITDRGLIAAGFLPKRPGMVNVIRAAIDKPSGELERIPDPEATEYPDDGPAQRLVEAYNAAPPSMKKVFDSLAETVTLHRPDGTSEEMTYSEAIQEVDHSQTTQGKRAK